MERNFARLLLDLLHIRNGLGDQLTDYLDSLDYRRLSLCSRRFRVYLIVPPPWEPWAVVLFQIFEAEGLRIRDDLSFSGTDSELD